jgi:hypothetical protein
VKNVYSVSMTTPLGWFLSGFNTTPKPLMAGVFITCNAFHVSG